MKKLCLCLPIILSACSPTTQIEVKQKNSKKVHASWYGIGDGSGSHTACGNRFNPHSMTTAHKTLKCGTKIRVTHKTNSVIVTVADRGPFIKGRELDLTYGAAKRIGMGGTSLVEMEILN